MAEGPQKAANTSMSELVETAPKNRSIRIDLPSAQRTVNRTKAVLTVIIFSYLVFSFHSYMEYLRTQPIIFDFNRFHFSHTMQIAFSLIVLIYLGYSFKPKNIGKA